MTPSDAALFERLRAERKRMADEAGVPAFVVLQDVSLRQMARDRPGDVQALLRITGVGAAKAARYGEQFLAAVADTDE